MVNLADERNATSLARAAFPFHGNIDFQRGRTFPQRYHRARRFRAFASQFRRDREIHVHMIYPLAVKLIPISNFLQIES